MVGLVDVGTGMTVPWELCHLWSARAGRAAGLIPRAARWLGVLSRHPPGGVLALPHPRVRGTGRELSLRPGLPETGAQVGGGGGGGGGGIIWSCGKPHPDRRPHQNRLWRLTPTHWNNGSAWDQPSLLMPSFMVVWETRYLLKPHLNLRTCFSNCLMIVCEICWAHEAALWVQTGPQSSLVFTCVSSQQPYGWRDPVALQAWSITRLCLSLHPPAGSTGLFVLCYTDVIQALLSSDNTNSVVAECVCCVVLWMRLKILDVLRFWMTINKNLYKNIYLVMCKFLWAIKQLSLQSAKAQIYQRHI